MTRATQVGEVLTIHRLDSEPLRRGLLEDEQLLRKSAMQMQSSMDNMGGAMVNVNAQAVTAQQTFGVLGAQVGAMGGAFGAATSSAVSFAGALSGVGKAAFGIPGLILAAVGAIGLLVNALLKQKQAAKEAREEFAAYTKTLRDEAAAASTSLTAMQQQAEVAGAFRFGGQAGGARRQAAVDEENLQAKANVQYRRRNELQAELKRMEGKLVGGDLPAHEKRKDDLTAAIELTNKTEKAIRDLITERRLKLNDDLAAITEQRLKRETEAEKRAAEERARIHAASPIGRVMGAIQSEIKAALEQQQMSAIFGRMKGLLPEGLRKSIEAKLGIGTPEAAEVPGGPAGRVAFAAGGFTDIAGAGGQLGGPMQDIERRKERRDEERNVSLKELLATLKYIASSKRKGVLA